MKWIRTAAFLTSLIAMLVAGGLSISMFTDANLPGCGPAHACDELSRGPWGKVAGLPVAFCGAAWFAGFAFVLLPEGEPRVPRSVFAAAAAGLPASILLTGVMIHEGKLCPYCVATHALNLVMVGLVWMCSRPDAFVQRLGKHTMADGNGLAVEPSSAVAETPVAVTPTVMREFGWLKTFVPVSVLALMGLVYLSHRSEQQLLAEERQAIAETVRQVREGSAVAPGNVSSEITGRHQHGGENARWRLVVFHDYCCGDCAALHHALEEFLDETDELSVSYRQLPLCGECNPAHRDSEGHAQACDTARLTEAAAQLHGVEGFQQLSSWFFERRGAYSEQDLEEAVGAWGWDFKSLRATSATEAIESQVSNDIALATARDLSVTPTVFINGVRLQGRTATAGRLQFALARLRSVDAEE